MTAGRAAAEVAAEPVPRPRRHLGVGDADTPTSRVTFATSVACGVAGSALTIRFVVKRMYIVPGHTIREGTVALRLFSAGGLAAVLAASLLVAGCTPDPGPTPTASPTSGTSRTPSASLSPTPTENAEERKQREAFEAAEKSYRTNFAEVGRLAMKGGTDEPSQVLRATSTGAYLANTMAGLRYLVQENARASQLGAIESVKWGGFSENQISLQSCEDYRVVMLVTSSSETVPPDNGGTRVYRQTIEVVRSAGAWKLSDLTTEQVESC